VAAAKGPTDAPFAPKLPQNSAAGRSAPPPLLGALPGGAFHGWVFPDFLKRVKLLIRERMARRSGLLAPLAAAMATSAALLLTMKPCGSLAFAPAALAPAGTPGCISQCSSAGCTFGGAGFVAEGPCLGGRATQAVPGTPICGAVYMAGGGRSGGGRSGGKRGGGGKARGGKTGPSPRAGKKRGGRGSTGGGRARDPDDDGYMEPQGRRITEMERVRTRLPRSHPCSCTAPAPAPRHVPQGAQIGR
jgi:hypothetical protein